MLIDGVEFMQLCLGVSILCCWPWVTVNCHPKNHDYLHSFSASYVVII